LLHRQHPSWEAAGSSGALENQRCGFIHPGADLIDEARRVALGRLSICSGLRPPRLLMRIAFQRSRRSRAISARCDMGVQFGHSKPTIVSSGGVASRFAPRSFHRPALRIATLALTVLGRDRNPPIVQSSRPARQRPQRSPGHFVRDNTSPSAIPIWNFITG
jgi:hypothetical protein